MEFYNHYKKDQEYLPVRHIQELNSITPIRERNKLPYKPHIKRSVGEYYPTKEDRVKLIKYLSDSISVPYQDRKHIKEKLKLIELYQYKGMAYGLLHASIMFVIPGIRLLPLYKRIILPTIVFVFWKNWGYNLGNDFVFVKGRNIIENWERDFGIRNNQTAF